MLTDSERFAFSAWRIHAFASTGNAYDAVQTDELVIRNLPKLAWIVIILLFPIVGGVAWLVAGRPTRDVAAEFISKKLWTFFAGTTPPSAVVTAMRASAIAARSSVPPSTRSSSVRAFAPSAMTSSIVGPYLRISPSN